MTHNLALIPRVDISPDGLTMVTDPNFDPAKSMGRPSMQPGLRDFLGVFAMKSGIGNIISSRTETTQLRRGISRAVIQMELRDIFPRKSDIVLAGSERQRAHYIIERARNRRTLLVDAEPHLVTASLTELLRDQSADHAVHLTIGATAVATQEESMDIIHTSATSIPGVEVSTDSQNSAVHIKTEGGVLSVVRMGPYSAVEADSLRLITGVLAYSVGQ